MKKALIVLGIVALLALVGAGIGWHLLKRAIYAPGHPDPTTEAILEVPRGTTGRGLGVLLAAGGYLPDPRLWRIYQFLEGGVRPKAGRYKVQKGMSIPELAKVFTGAPLPEDVFFTFVEGWRLRDADAALAAVSWFPAGAYEAAARQPGRFRAPFPLPARSLEGYLFPETYGFIPKGLVPETVIQRQLDTFAARFYDIFKAEIAASKRTLHEIVTMASLLEREEPDPGKRPLVAGILWRRLDTGMALGVDATSRYELDTWSDRGTFLKKLRDPADVWNTRLRKGLPPGPLGAPALPSLIAALRPVESPYWFYLHDATGELHPSRDAAEHARKRAKYSVY